MTAAGSGFAHPLQGVRLGQMERKLLIHAGHPEDPFGYVIDAPDRSVREQLRRASTKLVGVGLLDLEKVRLYGLASEPRREELLFEEGRFCRRTDATRAHLTVRNVVWRSPFGWQISMLYGPQLGCGTPIRWDARTVRRAEETAAKHWVNRHLRSVEIACREEQARDAVVLTDARKRRLEAVVPEEVSTGPERERWELAISVSRHRSPGAKPRELWDMTRGIYESMDPESLAAAAARVPDPKAPRSRAEAFRRRRKPLL